MGSTSLFEFELFTTGFSTRVAFWAKLFYIAKKSIHGYKISVNDF